MERKSAHFFVGIVNLGVTYYDTHSVKKSVSRIHEKVMIFWTFCCESSVYVVSLRPKMKRNGTKKTYVLWLSNEEQNETKNEAKNVVFFVYVRISDHDPLRFFFNDLGKKGIFEKKAPKNHENHVFLYLN